MAERRCSASPEEPKDSEEDQSDEERGQSEKRYAGHPQGDKLGGSRVERCWGRTRGVQRRANDREVEVTAKIEPAPLVDAGLGTAIPSNGYIHTR